MEQKLLSLPYNTEQKTLTNVEKVERMLEKYSLLDNDRILRVVNNDVSLIPVSDSELHCYIHNKGINVGKFRAVTSKGMHHYSGKEVTNLTAFISVDEYVRRQSIAITVFLLIAAKAKEEETGLMSDFSIMSPGGLSLWNRLVQWGLARESRDRTPMNQPIFVLN